MTGTITPPTARVDASGTPLAPPDRRGEERLRRLRIVALVVPATFLLVILLLREAFVRTIPAGHGHLVLDAMLVVATLAFSLVMFSQLDRAYQTVLQDNSDLAAVDAVAGAARTGHTPDGVAQACLAAVCAATGARSACITATNPFAPHHRPDVWGGVPSDDDPTEGRTTVPLSSGPDVVGSLTLSGLDSSRSPLTPAAFDGIGRAVGSALARARYLSHLQRECHDATSAERDRIARELHDSLAQVLGAAHFRLLALNAHPDVANSPDVRAQISSLATTCQEGYADVREAILGLREAGRPDRGLVHSLVNYAATFTRQSGIDTTLETDLDEVALPPHHEIQAVRVVQEALTNVRKHSGARSARVRIQERSGCVVFVVEDDGRGFHVGLAPDGHYGLATMRERAALLDGTLAVDSVPGRGTRVTLRVPAGPPPMDTRPGPHAHPAIDPATVTA